MSADDYRLLLASSAARRRTWRLPPGRWLAGWGVLALLIFYGGPLLMLMVGAWRTAPPGQGGGWTSQAWGLVFHDAHLLEALFNSLLISLLNLLLAVPLAAALAFISQRTDCPARQWITPAMLVMFAMPSLFYAMGFALLANPYTGLINALAQVLGLPLRVNIESWAGLALTNTFRCVAFSYLFMLGPFRALSVDQEEASLVCGRGTWGTFWRVSLPALLPALGGAAIFAIIGGLEVFDLALIIGVPAGIPVLAVRIFELLSNSASPQYGAASVLSLGLVVVVGALVLIQAQLAGRKGFVSIAGKGITHRLIRLGRARLPVAVLVWGYLCIAQVLPIGALVFSSFQPFPGVFGALSLRHYAAVLSNPEIGNAFATTLALALGTGLVTALVGLLIAELERSLSGAMARGVRFFAMVPMAMPGVVTALAITWAYVSVPGLRALYGTFWMMLLALVVAMTPLAVQMGQAALAQISPQLQEAAQVSGASGVRAWLKITLRLSLPSFLVSAYLAAVAVCGSLDIPLILGGPGLNTLSTTIYTLNTRGQVGQACALLCLLFLLIVVPALIAAAVRPWLARSPAKFRRQL